MRQSNVLLRWYSLHTSKEVFVFHHTTGSAEKIYKLLLEELQFDRKALYQLMINCSQMELSVKELLTEILQSRDSRWVKCREEAVQRVLELSEAFDGSRPLAKIEPNPQLQQWFGEVAARLKKLELSRAQKSGRLIIQVMQALDEVQEYHNLHANMLVKQQLQETRDMLNRMAQIINLKEDIEIHIQMISDFSYAWHLLRQDFMPIMQDHIKRQPHAVIDIRAIFLKLASTLEVPLMRINQARSED
ncbi:hypothetical protein KR067_012177, partial [Drosophila pandora]